MPAVYTNPATADFSTGHLLTATDFQTYLTNNLLALGGTTGHIGARVYNSASQSIPNATYTAVTFDTTLWDTDPSGTSIHSNSTNPTRLTCRTAGKYLVWGSVGYTAQGTGTRVAAVLVNGGTYGYQVVPAAPGSTPTVVQATAIVDLSPGDYAELQVYQDSGGALSILSGAARYVCEFALARI